LRIIETYPRIVVALAIVASGVVTYAYSEVQSNQQQCFDLRVRQGLSEIRSEVGLIDLRLAEQSAEAIRERSNISPETVQPDTLGALLQPEDFKRIEQNQQSIDTEIAQARSDRIRNWIDIAGNGLDIEKACMNSFGYSGLLVFLQIALASLASFVAFMLGDLKGSALALAAGSEPAPTSGAKRGRSPKTVKDKPKS
jgi:hypothetical protein